MEKRRRCLGPENRGQCSVRGEGRQADTSLLERAVT